MFFTDTKRATHKLRYNIGYTGKFIITNNYAFFPTTAISCWYDQGLIITCIDSGIKMRKFPIS